MGIGRGWRMWGSEGMGRGRGRPLLMVGGRGSGSGRWLKAMEGGEIIGGSTLVEFFEDGREGLCASAWWCC